MPVRDSKYANESKIQSGKHEDEKVACHAICEPGRACTYPPLSYLNSRHFRREMLFLFYRLLKYKYKWWILFTLCFA